MTHRKLLFLGIFAITAAVFFAGGFFSDDASAQGTFSCDYLGFGDLTSECYAIDKKCDTGYTDDCADYSGSNVRCKERTNETCVIDCDAQLEDGVACEDDCQCASGYCSSGGECVEEPSCSIIGCDEGLICNDLTGECESCSTDPDNCPDGYECELQSISLDSGICVETEDELSCSITGCDGGLICNDLTGECESCSTDPDNCPDGYECELQSISLDSGICVEAEDEQDCFDNCYANCLMLGDDDGTCVLHCEEQCGIEDAEETTIDCDANLSAGQSCSDPCECADDLVCDGGICVECRDWYDCPYGSFCDGGQCVEGSCDDKVYGLVPCGGPMYDDAGNIIGQCPKCEFRHLFVLLHNIVDIIIFTIGPALVAVMILVGGFMILLSKGNPGLLGKGKNIVKWALLGYLIVLFSWVIVNTILMMLDLAEWVDIENWWNLTV